MKYRTTLTAKAQVVEPKSEEFKTIAASLQDRYGFELKPQMDLLYVRSCLVSAGTSVGVNDNDDIFTRQEVWASRHTPVLKPFNWQHQDKDILGVMYTVQACDLEGNVLDINDDTPPDCDFDLWVEAAIFRLIHESRANEIKARSAQGTLYVSMEAWFDDYSYGLCSKEDGHLNKVLARNENTSFLDRHLRAGGGVGVYHDPDSGQDMRIGRVLRSITFGGCGFVDRPANKRSKIDVAEQMMNSLTAKQDTESQIELLLQKVIDLESQVEEKIMNTQAGSVNPEDVGAAVNSALEKREKAAAEKQEREALIARANEAETQKNDLQKQIDELSQAKKERDTEVQTLQNQLNEYGEAVEQLVQEQAAAGATGDTPAEIAAIDGATSGEAAFSAKLAWIQQSMASLRTRAARAAELETQLAEAEAVVREQEVRSLLGDAISEEALDTFVTHAASLDDESYARWRDEKELMILELGRAGKGMPEEMKKKMEDKKAKKDDAKANIFEALLTKRRSESGQASPDTPTDMGHLINHPCGDGVNSGVNSGQLKTPRHKIAGSAGDNPADSLENVQEEGGVSLAGAQTGDDGVSVNPFRVLASVVANASEEESSEVKVRPDFDPVK